MGIFLLHLLYLTKKQVELGVAGVMGKKQLAGPMITVKSIWNPFPMPP